MRYFKFRWNWAPGDDEVKWGDSWWYYEFDTKSTVTRQVMLYDNGFRLRYNAGHIRDDYGDLLWDVKLEEFDLSRGEEIHGEQFEAVWEAGPWTNTLV
jgi:hypothetical protein